MRRSHKKQDPDVLALKQCYIALMRLSPKMRRVTLEFLWDKYVTHAEKLAA